MPHLFVDISSHGLGHLAQTGPVLDALRRIRPDLRLTVRSGLGRDVLGARIAGEFEHLPVASDFGFVMHNAIDMDLAASADRYRHLHADWPQRVADEAALLKQRSPDLVLSNVSYLPLAGAEAAGLPAVALCSLNWGDLFSHYFGAKSWAAPIHAQIEAAYRSARYFLRITPGMPMNSLPNRKLIDPIARIGRAQRSFLAQHLGWPSDARWILVAMGGIDFTIPVDRWPRASGVRWLLPSRWSPRRDDMVASETCGLSFPDLLASVDAVVTKPGYGTFTEAVTNRTPVMYVRRNDWPEEPALLEWLHRCGRSREITRGALMRGDFLDDIPDDFFVVPPSAPQPVGAEVAAGLLAELLPAAP